MFKISGPIPVSNLIETQYPIRSTSENKEKEIKVDTNKQLVVIIVITQVINNKINLFVNLDNKYLPNNPTV
jgi:hypothetical protein